MCTVCGKGFARQAERKRHEWLHLGEKKFVCRGGLSSGGYWGCGRRFARVDALGCHFWSEVGQVCIKPLLEEEFQERDRALMNQQQQPHETNLQPIPQPLRIPGQYADNFYLPAALLAQYPALKSLQWDRISAMLDNPGDIGDHSIFDASLSGELGFDDGGSGISSVLEMNTEYPND